MEEDQLIEQALDQFINCHEQTYEEFLNTFTHLSKDHVIKNRLAEADSSGNSFAPFVYAHTQCIRNEHLSLLPVAQPPDEEQIVIDEGQKIGISIQGDLNWAGKVKADNFLDLEDFDKDEETDYKLSQELLLLPGEIEEDVHFSISGYVPSFDQNSYPEQKTCPKEQLAYGHLQEVPGDKVESFSLDEDFDYDSVVLTPKFSSAEIKAIR